MAANKMTIEDLRAIQQKVAAQRESYRLIASLCGGTGCRASESLALKAILTGELARRGLAESVLLIESGCNGFCAMGPVLTVLPGRIFYQKLTPADIPEVVEQHFVQGKPVERLMFRDPVTGRALPSLDEIPFFAHQHLRVLRNKGLIDPEKIDDYIWRDGYQAAFKALREMQPGEVIGEVKESGIRGRGGAGFPTGIKWEFCANARGDEKYVLCNADEGDPGAFMDRSVMEADPHSVLEGMLIGARAINARKGYIYCRAEYPLAIKRLNIAIAEATAYGLLGKDILGSGFDFEVEIYKGAGAFVCGEETALMISIQGQRGMPRPRPPFPAVAGLWGKPTVLNNVETWSNIPQIIRQSGAAFAEIGVEASKGTKVFALTGKVNNIGLVEVPMGTPIGKIIFDIGGGIPDGKKFKAAQLGGPSGGCIPPEHLNLPTDYEAISSVGAIMGSGGMIVLDEDTCMVDLARYFMDFCQDESCGKCTPCRIGTKRMLEILQRICNGQGQEGDVELLEMMGTIMKDSALCGLGQTAPNPVLSTIRYFRAEYDAHIREKRCPAGVCAALFESPCQNACPVRMDIPKYIALVRAGRIDDAYRVLKRTNPLPAVCGRVCAHLCQYKCRRSQLDEPLAIMHLKRFITDHAQRPAADPVPVTRPEKIAVVGAGPGGLTAALELKKRGYAVTLFEEMAEAGGMLLWGIPAYRLPRDVLRRDIRDILDTGIDLRTRCRIGRDLPFAALEQDYDAIFIAIGAQMSAALGIPEAKGGDGFKGATEFLRAFNLGQPEPVGRRVAVIGGGNSAIDAARTSIRLGAEAVTIFYRRERKDMPAQEFEIAAAEAEGVRIEYLVAPVRAVVENGRLSGFEFNRMRLESFDRSGRKRPVAVAGSNFTVGVDTVIAAIGQAADLAFIPRESRIETGGSAIRVDEAFRTAHPKVWAGGDVVTGPAMVIDAIAAGQKAARSIDAALRAARGEPPWVPVEDPIDIPFEIDAEVVETPQARMPEVAPADRRQDFREVELGFTLELAMAEARRCQRCDVKLEG